LNVPRKVSRLVFRSRFACRTFARNRATFRSEGGLRPLSRDDGDLKCDEGMNLKRRIGHRQVRNREIKLSLLDHVFQHLGFALVQRERDAANGEVVVEIVDRPDEGPAIGADFQRLARECVHRCDMVGIYRVAKAEAVGEQAGARQASTSRGRIISLLGRIDIQRIQIMLLAS